MKSANRARLALVALAVAGLAALATSSPPSRNVVYGNGGHVVLTPAEPASVEHVTLSVAASRDGARPNVVTDIVATAQLDARSVEVSVVRSSDGVEIPLAPSGAVVYSGGEFDPFPGCDLSNGCQERYTVTFRLIGTAEVSANWGVSLSATYADPVTDPGIYVAVEP